MEHTAQHPIERRRVPVIVWAALAIALAGSGAVLLFGVAVDKALTYSFFGLMLVAHFFMHAGGHRGHSSKASGTADGRTDDDPEDHRSHGGCH